MSRKKKGRKKKKYKLKTYKATVKRFRKIGSGKNHADEGVAGAFPPPQI